MKNAIPEIRLGSMPIVDQANTKYELASLGLEEADFREACRVAVESSRMATELHPRNAEGSYFWFSFIAEFRARVLLRGWTHDNIDGHDLTIDPAIKRAIVVTRGDANTGNQAKTPRTYAPKGRVTERAIDQNAQQLALFAPGELPPVNLAYAFDAKIPVIDGLELWMLLYYRDYAANHVFMELSLPEAVDRDRRPMKWRKRISLPPYILNPDMVISQATDVAFDSESIDIEVGRRHHAS